MKYLIVLIGIVFLNSSFLADGGNSCAELQGIWVFTDYTDDVVSMKKYPKFKSDEWGMQFKPNGVLVKRQNAGWCGTPPITYENFDGKWECTSDSTLKITAEYWGGIMEEELIIVELTSSSFKFKRKSNKLIEKN